MLWHPRVNHHVSDHHTRTSLVIAEKDLQLISRSSELQCFVSRGWGFVSTLQLIHTRNATVGYTQVDCRG